MGPQALFLPSHPVFPLILMSSASGGGGAGGELAKFVKAVGSEQLKVVRDRAIILSSMKRKAGLAKSVAALRKHAALCEANQAALEARLAVQRQVCACLDGTALKDEDSDNVTVSRVNRAARHAAGLAAALASGLIPVGCVLSPPCVMS